jgi:ParB family chromosome partitioning protein
LVPGTIDISTVSAGAHERVHKLALDIVVPRDDQPRSYFDEEALEQLAQSIREQGILQPIVVKQVEQNLYSIIAGERRWRAAKIAGLTEVPVIIRDADGHQQLELALLENVQRSDLSPLETAAAIQRLNSDYNQSFADIAKRLGKAQATVSNILRLLNLPPKMQESLQVGTISEGHGRALLVLQNEPEKQNKLFTEIVTKGLSVRQAEALAKQLKAGEQQKAAKEKPVTIHQAEKKLTKYLGVKKAKVTQSKNGAGKLTISFASNVELTQILDKIVKN